jgi:DNA modification methylase
MNVLDQTIGERFAVYNGDCVEVLKGIPDNSIHYSITSIPFASLYTYSNSERDMGNCRSYGEFAEQYQFLGKEWYRVMMPGRLVSIHCMNLPAMKERDGYIGMKDFRGDVIRWMESIGFIYHAEVCIWKDPVVEMQRTKALGLLHKQIKKDSAMSRMGIPDYLVTFRKPGENPERIEHTNESYPVGHWQQVAAPAWKEYSAPVWWDINQGNTLNRNGAREEQDEKHIAPLQLQVIERGVELWSNPNDVVLDPFDGIGSTGYQAVKMGRRHIGIELKGSYFKMASENLKLAEEEYKASQNPAQTRMV